MTAPAPVFRHHSTADAEPPAAGGGIRGRRARPPRLLLAALLACALPLAVYGADSDEDAALLGDIMEVLEESTEIATRSRLNADYVPGMVTVLDARDMEALGMRTVGEALAMIPGVQIAIDDFGSGAVAVRGFGNPFNSGNIKAMVNGVAMSREGSGLQSPALGLPIEQVERIEFIRGPGAAVYGDFAYAGVLNVITRADGPALFARLNGDGATTLGGRYVSPAGAEGPRIALDVAGLKGNGIDDGKGGSADEEQGSGILTLSQGGWEFNGLIVNRDYRAEPRESVERSHALELRRSFDLGGGNGAEIFASYLANDSEVGGSEFVGDTWSGGLESNWRLAERHRLLLEGSYYHSRIDRAYKASPPGEGGGPPSVDQRGVVRDYFGISLQDQYEAGDDLTLTAGARFDHRDDLETDILSPRLAAVWRLAEGHILKAQYGEGYRAPTFWELYPRNFLEPIDPETVATSEASWIHRTPNRVARVTLFHSRMADHITPQGPPEFGFGNEGSSSSKGVELEWEQRWSPRLKSWFNLSYADTEDGRAKPRGVFLDQDPTTADLTGNLALLYRLADDKLLGVHWNYLGERHAEAPETAAEHRVSLVLSLFDLGVKGLDLKLGVSNLLGADRRSLMAYPPGIAATDFPDSQVWGQIGYAFR